MHTSAECGLGGSGSFGVWGGAGGVSAAGDMADTLEALSINYLAGPSPEDAVQQPLRDQLRGQIEVLDNLCQQQ